MGVPPIIIHSRLGFSLINQPAIGYPHGYGNHHMCGYYLDEVALCPPGFMATIHAKPAPCAPTNTSASDGSEAPNSWGSGFVLTFFGNFRWFGNVEVDPQQQTSVDVLSGIFSRFH